MAKDELANIGSERTAPPKAPNRFWKPQSPERLVAKLDRIEDSRIGEYAVFRGALLRLPDGTPLKSGEFHLGLSGTMKGKLTPHDSGAWCIVDFKGYDDKTEGDFRTRLFSVRIATGDDVARVKAAAIAAHDRLVSHPIVIETAEVEDDLPF